MPKSSSRRALLFDAFHWFLHWEAAGGIVLLGCTFLALGWANSPWSESYFHMVHQRVSVSFGDATLSLSLQHWINDLLMALFFFVVGLEIKREMSVGELSSPRRAMLPLAAALGGMLFPAGIYALLNARGSGAPGWGIPMATDIAFALGILALFGRRVPLALKVFLTALAIGDDLGAVLVIALFYTPEIRWVGLLVALLAMAAIFLLSRFRVRGPALYILFGVAAWAGVLASGVHATVAGVLVAMLVPVLPPRRPEEALETAQARLHDLQAAKPGRRTLLEQSDQLDAVEELHLAVADMRPPGLVLEHALHPFQAFVVLPLFALFNAGVRFEGDPLGALEHPVVLGIVLGLFVGKQVGILLFSWLAIRLGGGALPERVNWKQVYGVACIAGVGFTMSLFVADLAFDDPVLLDRSKLGILAASLVSAVLGAVVLARALPRDGAPGS